MSLIFNSLLENYNHVLYKLSDDRTQDLWPSFGSMLAIISAYLYFVKVIGPVWMKDKNPYELKKTIFIYNIFQIIGCGYIFYTGIVFWIREYNWMCQPVDYNDNWLNKKVYTLTRMYLILKILDLLDTVFFVLRKKNRQISTLHVYHHTIMPCATWIGLKYFPNGHCTLTGVINCFVHVIMYTYYLMAGLGPQYQKYLWWKKYVTSLQLMQFVIVFIHNLIPLVYGCTYPKWINVGHCINSLLFIYMFGNFYYVNYVRNKKDNTKIN